MIGGTRNIVSLFEFLDFTHFLGKPCQRGNNMFGLIVGHSTQEVSCISCGGPLLVYGWRGLLLSHGYLPKGWKPSDELVISQVHRDRVSDPTWSLEAKVAASCGKCQWLSKPMVPFWLVGEFTTHFGTYFGGQPMFMFTGG